MMQSYKKGFTLIELLVVIAIIGLLASIVLAAVSSARGKGVDAAVKSQLNSARSAGELYSSNNNNNYDGVCAAPVTAAAAGFGNLTGPGILVGAASSSGATTTPQIDAIGTLYKVTCNDTSTGWALEAPLNGNTSVWCVDSKGSARSSATSLLTATDDIDCQ